MVCQSISLALGGGGARGVAHLGVIARLEAAGFEIERLVGVSIGSLVAALYAFVPDIRRVQKRIVSYLDSPGVQRHQQRLYATHGSGDRAALGQAVWWQRLNRFLRANHVCQRVLLHPSILPDDLLRHAVEHLLPDADIADADIPLRVVAVDLLAGRPVVLEHGPVRDAVRAAASIPGIFSPVELVRQKVGDVPWFDFSVPSRLIELGHEAARQAVAKIHQRCCAG